MSEVPTHLIARTVADFPGLPRRLQVLYDGEIVIIDDMLNPNSLERTVLPVVSPIHDRCGAVVAVAAIRGNRGADLDGEQATLLGQKLAALGTERVLLSCSRDTVGPADEVSGPIGGVLPPDRVRPMRVLLTNVALDRRRGSELYVRDVALELARRGHEPMAFSPVLGDVAQELMDATIPAVDRLDQLGRPPDVIHAHHHLPAMEALAWFPGVPAVGVSHGWRPWEEAPVLHPRVRRYVAVDEAVRDRLVHRSGIDPDRVQIVTNFVATARFPPRPPLPSTPRRVLLFSNYVRNGSSYLTAAREATEELGLDLEVIGSGIGKEAATPEAVIAAHDIVLAQGRSALEALTVGTAVVVCSSRAFGPMVTTDDYEHLRRLNFGIRTLAFPPTAETLVRELGRYDADDAANVARRVRDEADVAPAVDRLEQLYEEVLQEQRTEGSSVEDEGRAISSYLRFVTDRLDEASRLERDQRRLVRRLADTHRRAEKATAQQERAVARSRRLRDDLRFSEHELQFERLALSNGLEALDRLRASPVVRLQDRIERLPVLGAVLRRRSRRAGHR